MPEYVDGYVIPIMKKNVATYRRLAARCAKIWKKHGALAFRECVGDDLHTQFGSSFPQRLKLKRGETAMFSWITYKSRVDRDRVNAQAMQDPAMQPLMDPKKMPFDSKRMLFGGFRVIVQA